MERYNVRKVSGRNLDELSENLKILLNRLPDDEECVTVTLGLKDALVVTRKSDKVHEVAPLTSESALSPPQPTRPQPVPPTLPSTSRPLNLQAAAQGVSPSQQPDTAAQTELPRPDMKRPAMIFRNCPICGNQLILPDVPISVMCPHCKMTVNIEK